MNFSVQEDVLRCILRAKHWRFTKKRDLIQDTWLVYFATAYHQCMLEFLYADIIIDKCFVMNAGFLLGLLETVSCELHHTPHRFEIFFYFVKLQHFKVPFSCHSTTMDILSICIFDVRSNVFKVSLQKLTFFLL